MVRGDNTNQLSRPCDAVVLRYPSCKSIYSELLRKLLYSAVGLHHLQGKAIDCPLSTHLAYELAGADLVVIPQGDLQRTSTQLQTESNSQPQKRTKIPKYCFDSQSYPGPGSSKPNPGLVKFFISIHDPANLISLNEYKPGPFVRFSTLQCTHCKRIRLIFRNKLAGKFRLNPRLGYSGFEEPNPDLKFRRRSRQGYLQEEKKNPDSSCTRIHDSRESYGVVVGMGAFSN